MQGRQTIWLKAHLGAMCAEWWNLYSLVVCGFWRVLAVDTVGKRGSCAENFPVIALAISRLPQLLHFAWKTPTGLQTLTIYSWAVVKLEEVWRTPKASHSFSQQNAERYRQILELSKKFSCLLAAHQQSIWISISTQQHVPLWQQF